MFPDRTLIKCGLLEIGQSCSPFSWLSVLPQPFCLSFDPALPFTTWMRLTISTSHNVCMVDLGTLMNTSAHSISPPGYPLVMVPCVGLTHSVLFIKLLNVVLLGISLFLIRALVVRETPLVAWLAGGVALAYPVWFYTASTLYPQTLCMALLLGSFTF